MQKCSDMAVWLMWKICLLFTILCSWHTSCCRSRVRESKFLQFSVFLTQTIICEDSKMQWICFKIRVDVSRPKIASLTFCVFASPSLEYLFALSVGRDRLHCIVSKKCLRFLIFLVFNTFYTNSLSPLCRRPC